MTHRKPILDELVEIAPELAAISPSVPYKVPAGYFESLPQIILDRIADMQIGAGLTSIEKSTPYSVPDGYFNSLASSVLDRIKAAEKGEDPAEELRSISPLLAKLDKKMPYSVPQGYFENLTAPAFQAEERKPAKVVAFSVNKVFRYAVAAAVAGIIGVASWLYVSKPATKPDTLAATTDVPSEQQLLSRIDTISDTEIANFVETAGIGYGLDNNAIGADLAGADLTLLFEDVSDEELERYLQLNQPAKEKFN